MPVDHAAKEYYDAVTLEGHVTPHAQSDKGPAPGPIEQSLALECVMIIVWER